MSEYLDKYNSRYYEFKIEGIRTNKIRGQFGLPACNLLPFILESLATDLEYCEQLKLAEFIEIKEAGI